MLKRSLTLLLLLAAALGGAAEAQEPATLIFAGWGGPEEDATFRALVEQFNAANPDVVIQYTPFPEQVAQLREAIDAGAPPDIAFIPDYEFPALVTGGALVNLQAQVDAGENFNAGTIWPPALDRYRFDATTKTFGAGDLYALPKDTGPMVLYINEDLFEAAGVPLPDPSTPMTWDQVVEVATQLTVDEQGRHPGEAGFDPTAVAQYGLGDLRWELAVYGNGGRIISEDGRTFVAAQDENTIAALQWLADLRNVHQVMPTEAQLGDQSAGDLFAAGRVAMITEGRWQVPYYRSALPFNWSVRPNPVGPSGMVTAAGDSCAFSGWSASTGIGVIADSAGEQNLDAAFRFVAFMAGPEAQAALAGLDFAVPNQPDVASGQLERQADAAPDNGQVFLEGARCELAAPWTRTPLYGEWFDPLFWNGVWPDVMENGISAADAFAARAGDFQHVLDQAWAAIQEG